MRRQTDVMFNLLEEFLLSLHQGVKLLMNIFTSGGLTPGAVSEMFYILFQISYCVCYSKS